MTYRKPWTGGARAYPEADTLEDIRESMKRRRNAYMLHAYTADKKIFAIECPHCHRPVGEAGEGETKAPAYAVVTVYPKSKAAVFAHYPCSWSMLFERIAAIHL